MWHRILTTAVVIAVLGATGTAQVAFPRNRSLYLDMRDGTKIAIDVWLPEGLERGEELPTILRATRYWRAHDRVAPEQIDGASLFEADLFNRAGYGLVVIDARGSGASFGFRRYELLEDEVADYGEVVDWVVSQEWSNGRIGAWGGSYEGNTAEMLTTTGRSAVRAVAPLFNDFDNFGHLVFPGGVLNIGFLKPWSDLVVAMDRNDVCALQKVEGEECERLRSTTRGVKRVAADRDGALLAAAVAEHEKNTVPYDAALTYEFRDDPFGPYEELDVGYRRSPAGHLPAIEASDVPMLVRVGWLDAATVNGAIGRFTSIANAQRVFIGPWDHGAWNDADPFRPASTAVSPSPSQQRRALISFFDVFLKDGGAEDLERSITYYTLGADRWSTTDVWPPVGFEATRWYFRADGGLARESPSEESGADRYTVDFEATTGRANRWWTNNGAGDVVYPDRRDEDRRLLTYTSAPMEHDTEITGHPLLVLYVASTHEDGAFFAYLEDVAPDGTVTYVTEGQLRAVMRATSDEEAPYTKFGPHRTERRADALPLVPGETAEVVFDLWATSVLIRAGHRIRIALAGADKDSFQRYPRDGGTPTLTVSRNRIHASHVVLPIAAR